MIILPAVVIGLLIVLVGAIVLVYQVLYALAKWRNPAALAEPDSALDQTLGVISLAAGIVIVVVTMALLVKLPQWPIAIWIGLTALGVVGGLLSFVIPWSGSRVTSRPKAEPPPAADRPPIYHGPIPRAAGPIPPAPSAPRQDPYRELMAKAKYNQRLVDQLLDQERQRQPRASLDDLCLNAIARLEHERPAG